MSGYHGKEANVEKARFIGKMLSEIIMVDQDKFEFTYTLYLTRKSKYLLQFKKAVPDYIEDAFIEYHYEVFEDIGMLYNKIYLYN